SANDKVNVTGGISISGAKFKLLQIDPTTSASSQLSLVTSSASPVTFTIFTFPNGLSLDATSSSALAALGGKAVTNAKAKRSYSFTADANNIYLTQSLGAGLNANWANVGSGNWSTTSNWSGSVVPAFAGDTANFFSGITGNTTVTLNANQTI